MNEATPTVDGNKDRTWEELNPNDVFLEQDAFWMKLSQEDLVRVRPTQRGWMGYGRSFKYDPRWQMTFPTANEEEWERLWQQELYCDVAEDGQPLRWWLYGFLATLAALCTWWFLG